MARAKRTASDQEELKQRLARYREIDIAVIGRQSGRKVSRPVWFVIGGDRLYLLPVAGSETQWYKNILQNPWIRIEARGVAAEFKAAPIIDSETVKSVVEKFREKYGVADVKKYYTKFDVGVEVDLS